MLVFPLIKLGGNSKTMTSQLKTLTFNVGPVLSILLALAPAALLFAQTEQRTEKHDGRHICPVEAIRNGTCDPHPGKTGSSQTKSLGSGVTGPKRTAMYKRVARQNDTAANCNLRVKALGALFSKTTARCNAAGFNPNEELPISSQSVGITIWKVGAVQRGYSGARILSHPDQSGAPVEYQAERLAGEPILAYGDKVRLGIESPRDGYLYVFDRELYADGSFSAAYMIFPTARLLAGNNRIMANKPVELPSVTDVPVFFEAKKIGLDRSKILVGEILSVVITDQPISRFTSVERSVLQVPAGELESLEDLYSGIAEVFELENGVGQAYSEVERDAAMKGARLLTHADPVPQTFYLVKSRHAGGLLVTLALSYKDFETPQLR